MSYDKNTTPKYYCTMDNPHTFDASTIPSIKRQASKIANGLNKSVDMVFIHSYETYELVGQLRRINRKAPDGTIKYGKWN